MRTCRRCGDDKPLSDYCKDKSRKDGLHPNCRDCRNFYARQGRAKNPAASRAAVKRWEQANPERAAAIRAAWRLAHPDYSAEANRRWREEHPDAAAEYYKANRERVAENGRRRRTENADQVAATSKAWRAANKEKVNAAARRWQKEHPEKGREIAARRRARKRAAKADKVDLALMWGDGRCGLCRQPVDPDLQYPEPMSKSIDHIVPLARGGTHEQANVQLAHLVCNNRKGARVPEHCHPGPSVAPSEGSGSHFDRVP